MAGPAKKLNVSVPTELKFRVKPAPFRPGGNLKFLDLGKLQSRRCRIEVGEFETACCGTKLYAVVERGSVVRLELDKRKGSKPPPPPVKDALVKAIEAITRTASLESDPMPLPMPVGDFVKAMQTGTGPGAISRTRLCFSLEVNIPFVGERWFVCCVTWHRDSMGRLVIDEIGCGDWLSFQY